MIGTVVETRRTAKGRALGSPRVRGSCSAVGGMLLAALLAAAPAAAQSPPEWSGPRTGRTRSRCELRTSARAPSSPIPAPTRSASSSTRRTRTSPTSASSSSPPRSRRGSRPPATEVLLLPARPLDRLDRPGRGARDLALGGRLLLRPREGGRRRQRRGTSASAARRWTRRPTSPEYRPYFDAAGGGGVIVTLETEPDPSCAPRSTPRRSARWSTATRGARLRQLRRARRQDPRARSAGRGSG